MKRALVIGGTGVVGSAVLSALRERGVACSFTFHENAARADALSRELDARAVQLDLADSSAIRALARADAAPDAVIHAAGRLDTTPGLDLSDVAWEQSYQVNARGAFVICREFGQLMAERGQGDIVLVGALDRAQSLPIPVSFAAAQGLLAAMTMALSKELAPRGVRLNLVALGLLESGLSQGLAPGLREDFLSFSALRRFGDASEAARFIRWLALENSYIAGKVLSLNGGL